MERDPPNPEELKQKWLAIAYNKSPEWLAAYVESSKASWVVVTENGPLEAKQRYSAYFEQQHDLPFWAFCLAKAYLDDVGEWPLLGLHAEYALLEYDNHGNPLLAMESILATIKPVWPEMEVVYVGEEKQ